MASRSDIAHLLRRTGFAPTAAEIDALVPLPWPVAVEVVLDTSAAPSADAGPSMPPPTQKLRGDDWGQVYSAMTTWWLDRSRTTTVPLVEKMVLFWSGLLTSSLTEAHHTHMWDQNQLFRRSGLGKWDDLVRAASVQPAMLHYLDNRSNRVGRPNENFARELMELFTLGVGHYSEHDVVEAARAWTGHTVDRATETYTFRPDWHDGGQKTFMGVTRRWNGPEIVDHLLHGPTEQVAARHLARRLWMFLAHEEPAADLVDDLASVFVLADLDVRSLLRAILLRPEFRSEAAKRGRLRSPFEIVVAALRHAGLAASDLQPQWLLGSMGQALFRPPNVDGWGENRYWLSTTAAWARSAFADRVGWRLHEDASYLPDMDDMGPEAASRAALAHFGIEQPSASTLGALSQYVVEERAQRRWAVRFGLTTLVLMSPEFQST